MINRANISTVVVGGSPSYGPMQAAGGSRGARVYSTTVLDNNFALAGRINSTTISLLPNRTDTGVFLTYASINLRDQIRKGSEVPLQFQYDAADCRIFWTFETVNNYTNLWNYAARAIWDDPSLCVQGSRGFASVANDTTKNFATPASPSQSSSTAAFELPEIANILGQIPGPVPDQVGSAGLVKDTRSSPWAIGVKCVIRTDGTDSCLSGTVCKLASVGCNGKQVDKELRCVPTCNPIPNTYPCGNQTLPCAQNKRILTAQGKIWTGYCPPPQPRKGSTCAIAPGDSDTLEHQGTNLAGEVTINKRSRLLWGTEV
jgi:hypothetical protein